ncbi:PAS domain-containing protein [Shewanella sp. 202IG2-18]|uniref:PAS domain-containing protein n=1 Tax=Parashewanella hymeniacidonis TaxID=2807618 RepID=UPI001960B509|nr:PAS domain-containing protein [Parashewanella hymeniacidonis]MBM7072011.1 PAS domain-containing protein [Parashewanella hymeniacidonis]
MLTNGTIPQLKSLLFSAQGINWSYQRKLALASQLIMLLLGMVLLTNIIINVGERRLQNDWATQRYGELQTLGTMLSDKVSFQEFRTRTFAQSESLTHYLESPSAEQKQSMLKSWNNLTANIHDLLEIALFNAQGNLVSSSSTNSFIIRLPAEVINNKTAYSGNNVFTSDIKFAPINGRLEPYWYQVSWIDNPSAKKQGFLVTFMSLNSTLQRIKPDIGINKSSFIMLDAQGALYTGSGIDKIQQAQAQIGIGGSFAQALPQVWREIVLTKFGQFHSSDATFVFLKIDLTAQDNIDRDYYLVSFVLDKGIVARFAHWRQLMIIAISLLTILAGAVIILGHLFKLEKRARGYNVELVDSLFNDNHGVLIAGDNGRIVAANRAAASILNISKDKLIERTLARVFHIETDKFQLFRNEFLAQKNWSGKFDLRQYGSGIIDVDAKIAPDSQYLEQGFAIINLNDNSALVQSQEREYLLKKLSDSAVPVALIDTRGHLIKVNNQFDSFLRLGGATDKTLIELFGAEIEPQWNQIQQQISLKGSWQGHLSMLADGSLINVDILLNNYTAENSDNEHLICTLLPVKKGKSSPKVRESIPFRSAILVSYSDVERYFKSLDIHKRLHSSMMLMEIMPDGVFSHISDRDKLEKRQQDIEMRLLLELPKAYQLAQWQLGKLMIILPNTSADEAHQFALDIMKRLNEHGLSDGVCVGLVVYHEGQTFSQFMDNAEVALKRAKHNGEHNICQAYTRTVSMVDS